MIRLILSYINTVKECLLARVQNRLIVNLLLIYIKSGYNEALLVRSITYHLGLLWLDV
jgi:hypothetical protein